MLNLEFGCILEWLRVGDSYITLDSEDNYLLVVKPYLYDSKNYGRKFGVKKEDFEALVILGYVKRVVEDSLIPIWQMPYD